MNHSEKFNKVQDWYNCGFWTEKMVSNAVFKGWITKEEYSEITGKLYTR